MGKHTTSQRCDKGHILYCSACYLAEKRATDPEFRQRMVDSNRRSRAKRREKEAGMTLAETAKP